MANKEIGIVIKVMDQATAGIKSVGNSLTNFSKKNQDTFQNMSIAGGVAFAGITAAAYKGLKAYQEVERGNRQLENAIVNVSKGTKEQVKQVQSLTSALEKKVGVDADSLNIGVAQLSTFGLQTKSVVDLTKSLADLTINQNGLNATSDNYIGSANTIAKALNGQFGELTRMGIRFTETQKNMIEFGTESEKVKAIQEGLAQNLRETSDTVGGLDVAMATSQRNMESISESVGQGLAPAFAMVTEKLLPIISAVADWSAKNPELVGGIIIAVGAIAGLVTILGTLGLAIPAIVSGITSIGTVITLLGGPITILIALIGVLAYTIYSNWDGIKQGTSDFVKAMGIYWYALKVNLETIAMQIKNNIGEILVRGLLALVTGGMSELLIVWAGGWDNVVSYVYEAINPMVERVKGKLDAITGFVRNIKSALDTAKNLVGGGITAVSNAVTGKRAFGGTVQGGKSYLVGERGPEIITPASTSKVNTSVGGGMNISVNMGGVTVNNEADENRLVDKITQAITRQTQLYQFGIN